MTVFYRSRDLKMDDEDSGRVVYSLSVLTTDTNPFSD